MRLILLALVITPSIGAAQSINVRPAGAEHAETVRRVLGDADTRILTDERTGQVIVVGERSKYRAVDRLIRRLDRAPRTGERRVFVHRLKHQRAEPTRKALINRLLKARKRSRPGRR